MIINNFQFLIFTMWKETERPLGNWTLKSSDLITQICHRTGETGNYRVQQNFVYTRTQEKGEVTPIRDWITDWVRESGVFGGGMGWQWPAAGLGYWRQQVLLKQDATRSLLLPEAKQQGENTAPPINRKIGLVIYWWALSNRTSLIEPYNPRNNNLFKW